MVKSHFIPIQLNAWVGLSKITTTFEQIKIWIPGHQMALFLKYGR